VEQFAIVYVFSVQLHAMFVVFVVKLAGQFVVVVHVYHALVAVIVLHTAQYVLVVVKFQLESAVAFVQHTLIVAQFALAQNHQLTVYVFNVQLQAIFVVFAVKLAGQFIVVLHV
jgi:hypothetical protein